MKLDISDWGLILPFLFLCCVCSVGFVIMMQLIRADVDKLLSLFQLSGLGCFVCCAAV